MPTNEDHQPQTPPRADRDPLPAAPDVWFSAAAEAANCARVLGHRRHGLDTLLPDVRRTGAPS